MEENKRLWIVGILFLIMSSVMYVIGFLFISKVSLISVAFILGLLLFLAHQGFMWWILYQFAITRKRMSNKLHFLNKIGMAGTFGFVFLYLVLIPFIDREINESLNPFSSSLVVLIAIWIIAYQENNTHNFITMNVHKKIKQSKKEFNQWVGFGVSWMTINVLWLSIAFDSPLNLFVLVYILLLVLQSSLTYTTYGQSKYWNFTYEAVLLTQLFVTGLYFDNLIVYSVSSLLGLGFVFRQWYELEYKPMSKIIGIIVYSGLASLVYMNPLHWNLSGKDPSMLIQFPFFVVGSVFLVIYLLDNPKFYEKIFVK